jgi:hypothetical protein
MKRLAAGVGLCRHTYVFYRVAVEECESTPPGRLPKNRLYIDGIPFGMERSMARR